MSDLRKSFLKAVSIISVLLAFAVTAQGAVDVTQPVSLPTCLDHGKALAVNNDQALQWKTTQSSGFHARALITGAVDEVYPDHSGHRHFSVKIGPNTDDHIEVIYNISFGAMPLPAVGDPVAACGDYIVATQSNGGFPPSPDGALVHWVHRSPNGSHENGYVLLNGVQYGGGNGTGN